MGGGGRCKDVSRDSRWPSTEVVPAGGVGQVTGRVPRRVEATSAVRRRKPVAEEDLVALRPWHEAAISLENTWNNKKKRSHPAPGETVSSRETTSCSVACDG